MANPFKINRGTAAQRSASTATIPAAGSGIGVETDTGNIIIPDGTLTWAQLDRLVKAGEVTPAVQLYVSSLTVTNSSLSALAIESGYYWALADVNGRVAVGVRADGTFTGPKLVVPDATISLSKLTTDVQAGVQIPLPIESGYYWGLVDNAGHIAAAVTVDGSLYIPKPLLPSASISLSKLTPDVQAGLQVALPAESGYVWAVIDNASRLALAVAADGSVYMPKPLFADGSIALSKLATSVQSSLLGSIPVESGWAFPIADSRGGVAAGIRPDGSFDVIKQSNPIDRTGTAIETAAFLVVGKMVSNTHQLFTYAKATGNTRKQLTPSSSNAIDPRVSLDGAHILYRSDYNPGFVNAPYSGQPLSPQQTLPAILPKWRSMAVPVDGSSAPVPTLPYPLLAGWGDSLTAGTGSTIAGGGGYLNQVAQRLGLPCANFGFGGQSSVQIAARANATKATISFLNNTILASGPSQPTALSTYLISSAAQSQVSLGVTIAGVHGTLTDNYSATPSAADYTFTPDAGALSSDLTVGTNIPITTDFGDQYSSCISMLRLGRNNISGTQDQTDTISCINHITSMVKQYVIVSIIGGAGEIAGSVNYNNIVAYNNWARTTYPEAFVDTRKGLATAPGSTNVLWVGGPALVGAMEWNGISPTTADTIALGNDATPPSLEFDTLHLIDPGYNYEGWVIAQMMQAKGIAA